MFDSILDLLSPDMSKEEIKKIIHNNNNLTNSFENEINDITQIIKNGKEKNKVFNDIHKNISINSFYELICDRVNSKILPYEETTFIRIMEQNEYEKKVSYAFNNIILTRLPEKIVIKELELEVEQIIYLIKFLNTITEKIIINRVSIELFQDEMIELFEFTDKEKINFVWNLYDSHRKQLNEIVLLENSIRCKEIKQDTEFLITILKGLFNTSK